MKRLILAVLVCSLLSLGALPASVYGQSDLDRGIADLSKQISDGLMENKKKTIAVVEFVDLKGRTTNFGRFVAEKLTARLYQTKKFKVVERQMLNKIVAEQKLSLTGLIDPSAAQRLGKLLGVEAVATGTVTDLGKTLDINARLISTETAEIFAVASVNLTKDDSIIRLMDEGEKAPNSAELVGQPDQKQSRKVDAEFFTFDLVQCKLSGHTAICELVITNHDVERRLRFASGGVLIDDLGNSHGWREAEIANARGLALLVSGVPTNARITFDGIPPQVIRSPLLRLEFSTGSRFAGGSVFKVEFRNVALVK